MAPIPIRKDKTPYIGQRVLDGRTSAHDWEADGKCVPTSELIRSYNPKKGYIVSANNRQAPDHAKNDYGSGNFSTPRAKRITALIDETISNGLKFTIEDMKRIQLDVVDIYA